MVALTIIRPGHPTINLDIPSSKTVEVVTIVDIKSAIHAKIPKVNPAHSLLVRRAHPEVARCEPSTLDFTCGRWQTRSFDRRKPVAGLVWR